eukprot:1160937-Pelagomonas_calceolata.AAC.12
MGQWGGKGGKCGSGQGVGYAHGLSCAQSRGRKLAEVANVGQIFGKGGQGCDTLPVAVHS